MGFLNKLIGGPSAAPQPAPSVPTVGPSWIQRRTLMPGVTYDIVGEASYQDALLQLAGGCTHDGPVRRHFTAQVVREPKNKYDRNAVAVLIGGRCVGYIPANQATRWHPVIDQLAAAGLPATCHAHLTGGWDRGPGDKGTIGVRLDGYPVASALELPILPTGRSIAVSGEERFQDVLGPMLGGRGSVELIAQLGGVENGRLGVWIGGRQVGDLTPKNSDTYVRVAGLIHAAGLPPTCAATVKRGAKQVEVELSLPNSVTVDELEASL